MKILLSCLSQSWGGMEMYSLETASMLSKSGFEVDVLCYPNSRLQVEAEKENLSTIKLNFKNYFSPILIYKLNQYLRNNHYDLIHAEASKDLWLIVPSLQLSALKTPLILTKHIGSAIVKRDPLHRWIYTRVNLALAISNVIHKNLLETTTISSEKIILLHDSINTDRFNPEKISKRKIRNEYNISPNEILIGMNARFSPGKGHEEFLFAAHKLLHRYKNIKFMVVGCASRGEDDYAGKIKTMASYLGLDNSVIFTGFRNDIPEILASLDIFVFPSHAEAFGIALVEAMSMKLPSVCSNSDGILDIAVDNVTSYLFQKQNYHDLAEKLSELINRPDKRDKFGEAARERVLENFNADLITNKLIDIYDSLVIN
jgi:glycosyltransferase involved in cell wall biosynthesis